MRYMDIKPQPTNELELWTAKMQAWYTRMLIRQGKKLEVRFE